MERITIGSLVKHRSTGAVGLVIKHTMWDSDWGAFHVKFNKPAVFGIVTREFLVDRADRWELVSGSE